MKARFYKRVFDFKRPSGTSRGILTSKKSWFLEVWEEKNPSTVGLGECSIIDTLSPEFVSDEDYENKLYDVCNDLTIDLVDWPSIKFGLESALLDLENGGNRIYFNNSFAKGDKALPINGLVWMGDPEFMRMQVNQKISDGFTTIKMKVGAIEFEEELAILSEIRKEYDSTKITLRVDANGAFHVEDAMKKLERLAALDIHSIEQPIKAGDWNAMADLCRNTPLPIALDEELIGVNDILKKTELLETIQPQFIILKPSLHGGISGTKEWIELAESKSIRWWMTSALESNVGLKTICELTAEYDNNLPQGLGTGSLFTNNIESNLRVSNGFIQLDV